MNNCLCIKCHEPIDDCYCKTQTQFECGFC